MRDQHQRARELEQAFFKNFEGRNVEIVGGLVQEQDVRRFEHQLGDDHTRLFAAGETADRSVELLGPEHESLRPADHMDRPVVEDDGVAGGPQGLPERLRRVEPRTVLIEHHDLQAKGVGDRAGVRLLGSREHAHQRGLAAAVAAEEAQPEPRGEGEVELRDDRALTVALGHALRDDELFGPALRGREVDPDRGLLRPSIEIREFALHASRFVDAGLGLARARLGLPREPHEFAAHTVAQRILIRGLTGQKLILLLEVAGVVPGHVTHSQSERLVQLDHPAGDGFEEVAIVADGDERLGLAGQEVFEPENAFEVKVVGGFVEEQQFGLADEFDRDGETLLPAAGEDCGLRVGIVKARGAHHDRDPGVDLVRVQRPAFERRTQDLLDGVIGIERRILGHETKAQALARGAGPRARLLESGEDPEQGGLARTVRADEADVIALEHAE